VQELVEKLLGQGFSGSKTRNVVTALKVIYRRELEDDELTVNPTLNLRLPEVEGEREWDANPEDALALLESLGEEKALFATALLAGLRRGELKALRVCDLHGLKAELRPTRIQAGLRTLRRRATLGAWQRRSRRSSRFPSGSVFERRS
jgi:integrase